MSFDIVNGLGYRGDIGGKLKSSYGWYESGNGGDSSGFTALPASVYSSGSFSHLGMSITFLSSTEKSSDYAWFRSLYYTNDGLNWNGNYKSYGYSCRCLKNK